MSSFEVMHQFETKAVTTWVNEFENGNFSIVLLPYLLPKTWNKCIRKLYVWAPIPRSGQLANLFEMWWKWKWTSVEKEEKNTELMSYQLTSTDSSKFILLYSFNFPSFFHPIILRRKMCVDVWIKFLRTLDMPSIDWCFTNACLLNLMMCYVATGGTTLAHSHTHNFTFDTLNGSHSPFAWCTHVQL